MQWGTLMLDNCPEPDYSGYQCYALSCNPALSVKLAYKHFTTIEERETLRTVALATGAAMGKSIANSHATENHWLETSWGRQYWELKQQFATVAYGGGFQQIQRTDRHRSQY